MNSKELLTTLRNSQEHLRLSSDERMRIVSALGMKSLEEKKQASASPYVVPSYSISMKRFSRHIVAALVIFVFTGGAVSVAASESALPGMPLYPIKVRIAEEFTAFLQSDVEGRTQWEIVRAERRLEEAATLASQGKLTVEHQATLAKNIEKHSRDAQELINQIPNDEFEHKLETGAKLETTLRAHAKTLKDVAVGTSDATSLVSVIDTANKEADRSEVMQEEVLDIIVNDVVSDKVDPLPEAVVGRSHSLATQALGDVGLSLIATREAMRLVSIAPETQAQFSEIEMLYGDIKNMVDAGVYKEALVLLQDIKQELGEIDGTIKGLQPPVVPVDLKEEVQTGTATSTKL